MSEYQGRELQEINAVISGTLDKRIAAHKAAVAAVPPVAERPLNLLAEGDSWFDYPLSGILLIPSGIITQLSRLLDPGTLILNLAHYGDTATGMLGISQRQRLKAALGDPAHGDFDALLFSGGGNDIAGDQFRLWLNQDKDGNQPINEKTFNAMLEIVIAAYEDLLDLRDEIRPNLPVFIHGYDYALPSGVNVCGIGPWLRPSLIDRGWMTTASPAADGRLIVQLMLARFRDRLTSLAAARNDVILVHTQGLLNDGDWANELHPTPGGFVTIAEAFIAALDQRFPARVRRAPAQVVSPSDGVHEGGVA